ncbi:MAG TPA: DUF222 domain-containing protein [Ilumatobacteraceae bacterium]|nr:DUF222 domain-containing protein [Ilumatobacteraceae bacterium]
MLDSMNADAVVERVRQVAGVCDDASADTGSVEAAMVAIREVTSWAEAQHATLVSRLSAQVSFPEAAIAAAAKTSVGVATKSKERSETLAATPRLAGALADGAVTSGHVDAVTRGSKQLDPVQRTKLFERIEAIVPVAEAATVEQFSKRVGLEVRRIQTSDGIDRLERQRRETRLSAWVDHDGMWNLRGRFDPVTGVKLDAKLRSAVETLFVEQVPDHCPADPIARQQFLAAHGLARLLDGAGNAKSGRGEFVAVIDADAPGHTGPVAEWSIPVEIPARVIAELAGEADVHAVVVRNGVVLYAPGELDLGRTTRLANRAQRRALRGLYSTCGIPGCTVGYDRCKLHHVIWWSKGGSTDLDNLLPVCPVHHAKIHHGGWIVELGPNRELTLTLPDGRVMTTGPPSTRAG